MKRMNGTFPGFGSAALLVGLMAASCVPTRKDDDLAGSGTELGNVVGSLYTAGNLPAAGITVTLYPEDSGNAVVKTAVTDADGNFAFQGVMGAYSLYALDGQGNGLKVDSIDADTAHPIDLERQLLSPLASISGYVKVNGVRPSGAADARVEIYLDRSPFRIAVDANSAFVWPDLPAGRYWLGVYYSWSKGFTLPIILAAGETLDLDTLVVNNEYSAGISRSDTLKVSSSQLPLTLGDKLANDIGAVDSVFWILNGERMNVSRMDRYFSFALQAGDLRDSGYNVLEMRLYLPDTTVSRAWYIDLDDSRVIPWARHAVKGVFLGSEENPRPNSMGAKLGTFRILERRPLAAAEMAFWQWTPVPGGDTALPSQIKVPMLRNDFTSHCGELAYEADPELFPGDTVTFVTLPDEFWGGTAMRIRKDEDYSRFGSLAWFGGVPWPLADLYYGKVKGGTRAIRIGSTALDVRLSRDYRAISGLEKDCIPVSRGFTLGADGIPREYVAMPDGMSSGNLLLHFRVAAPKGLIPDALADSGDYVFIDSAGNGVAGSGTNRREIHLSASELAELETLLTALPAVMPIEWDKDYLQDSNADPKTTRYLLSGGRGSLLSAEPRSEPVPQAKLDLFQAVEAWLRGHSLL